MIALAIFEGGSCNNHNAAWIMLLGLLQLVGGRNGCRGMQPKGGARAWQAHLLSPARLLILPVSRAPGGRPQEWQLTAVARPPL